MTMLYALEREFYLGSTFAVLIELSEGRDVSSGPEPGPSDLRGSDAGVRRPSTDQTDNGAPFAGTGLMGLSKLSIGWMKLGIVHERDTSRQPQQNGHHERMHRTLKEDTTKPPAASLRAQQSRFDNFRYVFNNERPHEGLNNRVPASLYYPSSIRLPRKLPEFNYPKGILLRRVNNSGDISWHKTQNLH